MKEIGRPYNDIVILLHLSCRYKTYEFPPGSNSTMTLDNETTVAVARGSLQWPIPGQHTADMAVLPGLVSSEEVSALLSMMPETFDRDADTVDNEETFEFYLEVGYISYRGIIFGHVHVFQLFLNHF